MKRKATIGQRFDRLLSAMPRRKRAKKTEPTIQASETNTRDDILRRMLKTPPKPHKAIGKKRKSPKRRKNAAK